MTKLIFQEVLTNETKLDHLVFGQVLGVGGSSSADWAGPLSHHERHTYDPHRQFAGRSRNLSRNEGLQLFRLL
jgi:hypothetical protein